MQLVTNSLLTLTYKGNKMYHVRLNLSLIRLNILSSLSLLQPYNLKLCTWFFFWQSNTYSKLLEAPRRPADIFAPCVRNILEVFQIPLSLFANLFATPPFYSLPSKKLRSASPPLFTNTENISGGGEGRRTLTNSSKYS